MDLWIGSLMLWHDEQPVIEEAASDRNKLDPLSSSRPKVTSHIHTFHPSTETWQRSVVRQTPFTWQYSLAFSLSHVFNLHINPRSEQPMVSFSHMECIKREELSTRMVIPTNLLTHLSLPSLHFSSSQIRHQASRHSPEHIQTQTHTHTWILVLQQ